MLADNNKFRLEGGFLIRSQDKRTGEIKVSLIHNTDQSLPTFLNLFNTAFFNYRRNLNGTQLPHYEIYTTSRPWEGTSIIQSTISKLSVDMLFLGLVIFAYALLPSSFSVPLIKERETGVKQLQLISGTSKFAYWISNLLWDVTISTPVILLTCLIFYISDSDTFSGSNFGTSVLILFEYVIDSTLLSYLLSMLWNKHVKAQVIIFLLYFVVGAGFLSGMLTPLLLLGSRDIVCVILSLVFCILCPQFAMANGFMVVINFAQYRYGLSIDEHGATVQPLNVYDLEMVGIPLIAMAAHSLLFFIVLLLVEYSPEIKGLFLRCKKHKGKIDMSPFFF